MHNNSTIGDPIPCICFLTTEKKHLSVQQILIRPNERTLIAAKMYVYSVYSMIDEMYSNLKLTHIFMKFYFRLFTSNLNPGY